MALADNNGPPLTLSANGVFTFPAAIAQNGAYSVTVTTQPAKQVCTVTNASGSNVQANVSSVGVSCVTHNLYVGDSGAAKIYQFALASNGTLAPLTAPSVTAPGNIGQVILDNTGSYLYATMPSLNEVAQYSVGSDGSLTAMATPIIAAGAAPYEEAVSPDGKWLFVGDQGGYSVDSYAIGTSGALTHVGTYTCGNPNCGNVQGLAVDTTSSHLYVAAAQNGYIMMMSIATNGSLALQQTVANPLGNVGELAISPNGTYLLSGAGSTEEIYPIAANGTLATTPSASFTTTGASLYPLLFNQNDLYIGIGGSTNHAVDQFSWSDTTGTATALSPASISTDPNPQWLAVDKTGTYLFALTRTNKLIDQFVIGAGGVLTANPNGASVPVTGATDTYTAMAVR